MSTKSLKDLYRKNLTVEQQQHARHDFCEKFSVERNCFYTAIRTDPSKLSGERLEFFALTFGCTVDELLRSETSERKKVNHKKALEYGLS